MNEVVSSLRIADCRAVSSLRWTRRLFLSRYRRITDLDDKVSIRGGITLRMAENEREGHVLFLMDDETERRMEEWKVCITPDSNGIQDGFAGNLQGMYNHSVKTLTDGGVTLKVRRWHHS